ncbi:hypothetical protein LOC08_08990 [Lactobacillus delbrueckii subsp. lactis]|uniref:hypothetical protein n=1 Tax=Lactobacillus delbrueckii TaxID=1584 RepID=UPI001E5B00F3|nr:hypothetical protein [Lactobacillus delbrueckii]MCD5507334.1 hypothetical protein [Lactobacillus delbrueckii subsp. lactis]MCD5520562.1 hypothetical protein [Lactobacillus delbrueckii subsp. lactis]MCD5524420.1 hypothetical protein [Lactobacillus delbrueckii subsp. lactis]MCD5526319.1 hypothetical protein [Lactobacillus delbrueckii subsp. lactis]
MTAFTGVDSQNLPDVMVSVQFILAIGEAIYFLAVSSLQSPGRTWNFPLFFCGKSLAKAL